MNKNKNALLLIITLIFCGQVEASYPKIVFPATCIKGQSLTMAAVGDVLLHRPLQEKGVHQGFQSLWQALIPYFRQSDITYANLEGPIAAGMTPEGRMLASTSKWDPEVYTSFPAFNYHPSLALALKNSGIDVVSTANNHALDRNGKGIDKTVHALESAGIRFTGTRPKHSSMPFVSIVQRKNFKLAFLACTEHTNGIDDYKKQVLYCYKKKDRETILSTIQSLKNQVDAIIVTPHFGEEYEHFPNAAQKNFAHQVLDAGALIVIGSHPHVLQPMERYVTKDGRNTLISYSLGNFVSYQGRVPTRTSMLLFIGLTKTPQGTQIYGVNYAPLYMDNRSGRNNLAIHFVSPTNKKTAAYSVISKILPLENAIDLTNKMSLPECLN